MDGMKKRRNTDRKVCLRKWHVSPHRLHLRDVIHSVIFLSDGNQFGQEVTLRVQTYLKLGFTPAGWETWRALRLH